VVEAAGLVSGHGYGGETKTSTKTKTKPAAKTINHDQNIVPFLAKI
jgi:3D (Asp-Asp-Asp) domain-containing protein